MRAQDTTLAVRQGAAPDARRPRGRVQPVLRRRHADLVAQPDLCLRLPEPLPARAGSALRDAVRRGRRMVHDAEEINVLAPGTNGGWPCYEGTGQTTYSSYAVCQTLYAAGSAQPPLWSYEHAGAGASLTAGMFYTGTSYPAKYRDSLFFGDYVRGQLWTHGHRRHRPPHPGPRGRRFRRGRGRSGGLPPGSQRRRDLRGHHQRQRAPTRVRRREPASGRQLHHDLGSDDPHRELLGRRLLRPRRRRAELRLGLRGRRQRGGRDDRRTPTAPTTRCR